PVPKLVLNALGAWPKPMNPMFVPVANPLLKPLLKLLPLNCDPNGLVKPLVGRVRVDWAGIWKNEPSGVAKLWKALPNALETAVVKPVLPNGRFCRAASRLLVLLAAPPKSIGWSCAMALEDPGNSDRALPSWNTAVPRALFTWVVKAFRALWLGVPVVPLGS